MCTQSEKFFSTNFKNNCKDTLKQGALLALWISPLLVLSAALRYASKGS